MCACVCASVSMCEWSVRCHGHTKTRKKSGVLFLQKQPPGLAATKSIQQQYSGSGTTTAVLQALAFVLVVVTVYVCMVGAQQQEVEPLLPLCHK